MQFWPGTILRPSSFKSLEALNSSISWSFAVQNYYPSAFLKKRRGYCYPFLQSVYLLCSFLLNHWAKFNQISCVSYSHKLGVQHKNLFCPAPWSPGEGSNIIYFNYKVNFKNFRQTLSVFSQMKGVGLWGDSGGGCPVGQKNISNMVMWHIKSTGITSRTGCR